MTVHRKPAHWNTGGPADAAYMPPDATDYTTGGYSGDYLTDYLAQMQDMRQGVPDVPPPPADPLVSRDVVRDALARLAAATSQEQPELPEPPDMPFGKRLQYAFASMNPEFNRNVTLPMVRAYSPGMRELTQFDVETEQQQENIDRAQTYQNAVAATRQMENYEQQLALQRFGTKVQHQQLQLGLLQTEMGIREVMEGRMESLEMLKAYQPLLTSLVPQLQSAAEQMSQSEDPQDVLNGKIIESMLEAGTEIMGAIDSGQMRPRAGVQALAGVIERLLGVTTNYTRSRGRYGAGMFDPQDFSDEVRRWSGEIRRDNKLAELGDIYQKFQVMKGILDLNTYKKNKGAIDNALINLFVKTNDPTSVVRQSEYLTVVEGTPLWSRIWGAVNRLREGGSGLTDDERRSLVEVAGNIVASLKPLGRDRLEGYMRNIAYSNTYSPYQINPLQVVPQDMYWLLQDEEVAEPQPIEFPDQPFGGKGRSREEMRMLLEVPKPGGVRVPDDWDPTEGEER